MNPKEKAEQLREYYNCLLKSIVLNKGTLRKKVQLSALIAVNEILDIYKTNWNIDNSYWEEVKDELNKDIKPSKVIRIKKPDELSTH